MTYTAPKVGKTYICNIPDSPEIKTRVKVEKLVKIPGDPVFGLQAGFIATCSFVDDPSAPQVELLPDEWEASGFSLV